MPRQTYFNLNKEKQNKIFQAAFNEFSKVPFDKATIKNIIQEANIPKGSFYQYFENIEDLYQYVLQTIMNEKHLRISKIISKVNDLFDAHKMEFIEELSLVSKYNDFFKNVFLYYSYHTNKVFNPIHIIKNIDCLINHIDTNNFKDSSKEHIFDVFMILNSFKRELLMIKKQSNLNDDEIIKMYDKKVEIIKYGVLNK